jgi:hypothetical protein
MFKLERMPEAAVQVSNHQAQRTSKVAPSFGDFQQDPCPSLLNLLLDPSESAMVDSVRIQLPLVNGTSHRHGIEIEEPDTLRISRKALDKKSVLFDELFSSAAT